jgi:hypothetical protein
MIGLTPGNARSLVHSRLVGTVIEAANPRRGDLFTVIAASFFEAYAE